MADEKQRPRLMYHNDGNSWLCSGCWKEIPRSRANPYPEHDCRMVATRSPYDANGLKEFPGE